MEPYRVRVVEPIFETTRARREALLEEAAFNLYQIDAENVLIDLLTDSGTCAMSATQVAAMMRGDESYAGSASYRRFEATVREVFGFEQVVPTHQGRAAERLLMETLGHAGDLIPSNTLFETTRANCLARGMEAADMPAPKFWEFANPHPFKGDMDCDALEDLLDGPEGDRVPFILLTITNNLCGDQPVSLANIRRVGEIAKRHGKPLYFDACRFAQNVWFIKAEEDGYGKRSIREIVHEMFSYADGCIFSAKKDALAQIGGFFACRSLEVADRVREGLVLSEGFVTYGGMTGRDMETISVGLTEVLDDAYLQYRTDATRFLFESLHRRSIPMVCPAGGHAVYIDATSLVPHLGPDDNPGQAVAVEIFAESGVRTARITLNPDRGPVQGRHVELVRLALPSRVYSTRHLEFVAESVAAVAARASSIEGLRIVSAPRLLSGFLAKYKRAETTGDLYETRELKTALL